jgi:hypothetical protein
MFNSRGALALRIDVQTLLVHSAYQAELGGFVTILHIVLSIYQFHNSLEGNITINCDCQSAINHLQKITYGNIKDYLVADFDLLHEGRTLLPHLRTTTIVTLSWVKGHYTEDKKSIQHSLNKAAHKSANDFLHKDQSYFNPSGVIIDPPTPEVSIFHDSSTITSNLPTILQKALHSAALQNTICKTEKLSEAHFDKVDWAADGRAFQSIPRSK